MVGERAGPFVVGRGAAAFVIGADSGLVPNTAHELGHKHNPLEQMPVRLALAVPAYEHLTVERGRVHHRWMATPEDTPARSWVRPSTASRRHQCLRHFADLPQLPSGYFGMFAVAYWPRRWFRVLDPRLMALPQAQGDVRRVNVCPQARTALQARLGVRAG